MKKTLLLTLEFPPFYGGVANYYYNIVKRLPVDKIVVLTSAKGQLKKLANFKIYYKKLITNLPIWPKWSLALVEIYLLVKKEKIEIIWAGQVLPLGTICLLTKKLLKIPYFISLHGTDLLTAQKNNHKKKLLKIILDQAEFITANSQFTKNEILKLGIAETKIIIIYPCPNEMPVTNKNILNELINEYQLQNKKLILSVGRLVQRKGQELVIKALPSVIKKFPEVKYLIIGQGPLKNHLLNLINQYQLENYVYILDNINTDLLPYFYQLTNLFILTPITINNEVEGLGMVFQEAALFAKPIIGSFNGGIPEIIIDKQTGILVDPANLANISQAIIAILTNHYNAHNLGQAAKSYVLEKFQWSNEVEKLINLLNYHGK